MVTLAVPNAGARTNGGTRNQDGQLATVPSSFHIIHSRRMGVAAVVAVDVSIVMVVRMCLAMRHPQMLPRAAQQQV